MIFAAFFCWTGLVVIGAARFVTRERGRNSGRA